ncbi:MAG: hypothetical protein OXI49_09460 [Acidobacteriota bacterium]|nr:hypothetical protein [Acidobacteriota bacterium]
MRSKIGDDLEAETDEAVMLAFYSDPRNRRELWDHWRANPRPAASVPNRRKGGRPEDEPPPSLEYCILDNLDRSLLQSEGSDDVLVDRLREEVDSRLNRWSEMDNAERRQTVHLAFTLASLLDDRSVLQRAVDRVDKLAGEFEKLLQPAAADPPPNPDIDPETPGAGSTEVGEPAARSDAPNRELLQTLQHVETTIDSAFSSLHGLVEEVEDAESLEIFGGFATSVEDRVQTLQGSLTARRQRLDSRKTTEELQSAAARFLDEIARSDAAAGIRADVDELADGWSNLSQLHPREATAEFARLRSEVQKAIETLEQAHNDYGKLEQQRISLQDRKPTSREEQRNLDERLDALHEQRVAARNRHRAAEDALLAALTPSVAVQGDRNVPQTDAEVPAQAERKPPKPPAAQAENDPADTESPAVQTEKERKAEPAQTPAQPDQPLPREKPVESDDSKTRKSPAPSAAAAETAAPAGAVGEEPADPASPLEEPRPTPAPATPKPPKAQAWNERERSVRKALAEALADEPPRLAEAFQICRLAEELEITAGQPRSAVVEAALYASHLRQAHGELAADLREVIENAPSEPLPGSTPAQVNAEALLRFAGAVVPTLLAPHTGAAAWLQGLTHEGLLVLYDFSHQAAERGWAAQTAGIDAGSFLRRAGHHLKQGDAMAALRRDLASWREGDATLPLGYVPAKKVWSALLREGPLDRLLKGISHGADADQVRTDLAEIEDRDSLRKRLDDLSARLLNRRQSIDQKIFRKIRRRLDRPCELARKYLDLLDATTDHPSHHQEVLSNFVRLIQNDAPGLHQELQTVKARRDEDPLVRAAANAASSALTQVEKLVDLESRAAATNEPTTEMVRASGLFRYPQIRIADSGLADGNPEEDLRTLSSAPVPDLTTALETRIEAADLLTAQRILDWPASTEQMSEDDSERWRERLASSREDRLHSLKEDAETLRDALESAYLYGQLAPDDRLGTDLRLSALEERIEDRKVVHFDRSVAELDSLRRELERAKDGSLQALRSEAQSRLAAEPDRLREIERHINDGDLVAANELLFRASEPRVRTIEDLTGPGDLLDSYLAADRGELRAATKDWSAVVEAAKEGGRQGVLLFDELDEDDRVSAADLLERWGDLRTCSRVNRPSVAKVARELFSRLGFTDVRVKFDRNVSGVRRGMWTGELLADTLANRDECAIAQFGSLARGRYRLLVCFDAPTPTQVGQELGGAYSGQAAIVVCAAPLSDGIREQLTRTSFEKKLPFVVLDQSLLAFLAMQASPRRASFFALTLPFSYCKAFQTRSSFVPPEMFFGRDRERSEVSNFDEGSCFLYGGRQLGKTALLRKVQEEFTSPERGQFAVWIDLKDGGIGDADTADVWAVIWKHLQELGAIDESAQRPTREPRSVGTFCEALHSRFNPKTRGRLLILLDEADNFLRRDALNSSRATFAESSRLKALMERNRSIKVVFAGLHNVLRTTNQSNHPLAHMGTPICIGPFIRREERQEAEDLISVPLRACGYRFDPRRLTRSVLARANYYPSLLQIYGNAIADRLSAPARRRSPNELPAVSADLLDGIHRDRTFQDEIRKRFVWTLELDPRYEAIAYVLAYMCHEDDRVLRDGTGVERLFDEARAWWEVGFGDGYDTEQFKALLEEMVELGVLRLTDQPGSEEPKFSLRNPNVLALLGNAQALEAKLLTLEERPATPELGPREIRRRDDEKGPLHRPLTLRQEHEIEGRSEKGTGRNEVVLVCGTEAAGARHVLDFLTAGKGTGEVERLKAPRSRAGFERDLRSRLRARKPGTTVLLCDATAQTWHEDWLRSAQGSLETLRSRDKLARVVFALDANRLMAHRRTIIEREERGALRLVELKPWSLDFAARCLDDDQDVGHRLDPKQERELADLAGGWPVLLDLVVQALRNGGHPEHLTSKAGFRELLLEHAAGLREAFALEHAELAPVLQLARELGTATEEELLDPEARELAACSLGDDELRSAIWAAVKLHLLQVTGPAEWRVDPVVAQILLTRPD